LSRRGSHGAIHFSWARTKAWPAASTRRMFARWAARLGEYADGIEEGDYLVGAESSIKKGSSSRFRKTDWEAQRAGRLRSPARPQGRDQHEETPGSARWSAFFREGRFELMIITRQGQILRMIRGQSGRRGLDAGREARDAGGGRSGGRGELDSDRESTGARTSCATIGGVYSNVSSRRQRFWIV